MCVRRPGTAHLSGSPAKLATLRNLPEYSPALAAKKTCRSAFTASNTAGGVVRSTATCTTRTRGDDVMPVWRREEGEGEQERGGVAA